MYCVMGVFYKDQEGCVISNEVIVQGDIVNGCCYVEFMYILVNVVVVGVFGVDIFGVFLDSQVGIGQIC